MGTITEGQLEAISAIERAGSVLSLLGCLFTIITFCSSQSFRKPINRLVFYASFGNIMANVGTLMSRSYLSQLNSFGCQSQAFLIQLFMPADAFWTLAMAINVFLTFYFKFDAKRLQRMEIPYLITCYGTPLVPALTLLFIKNSQGSRVYGNAVLWCWIDSDWHVLRIACFYAPIWVVILVTLSIYIRAGCTIYETRKQLRDFHSSDPYPMSVNGEAVTTITATEISVTTEMIRDSEIQLNSMDRRDSTAGPSSKGALAASSVHISADSYACAHSNDEVVLPMQGAQQTTTTQITPRRPPNIARRCRHELNNAAWSYTKCSILFFTAILITWIPSSANRVYSLAHEKEASICLQFMSAFVLPLQGFWNAIIYTTTSWSACLSLFESLKPRQRPAVSEPVSSRRGGNNKKMNHERRRCRFRAPADGSRTFETESTTQLAEFRTNSANGSRH